MKRQTSYSTIFIILSIITLLLFGAYIFSVWLVKETVEKASVVENEIARRKEQDSSFDSIQKLIQDTQGDRDEIEKFFVKDSVIEFLERVESLATTSSISLEIKNVAVLPSFYLEKETEFLNLSMNISGSWFGVYQFLQLLETLPEGVMVQKTALYFGLNREADAKSKPMWNGEIDLLVWKLK